MKRRKKIWWDQVVAFFNIRYAGGSSWRTVWRKLFIEDKMFKGASRNLIETYRLYLTRAGYLNNFAPGLYLIVKPIPASLTSKECYRQAYGE